MLFIKYFIIIFIFLSSSTFFIRWNSVTLVRESYALIYKDFLTNTRKSFLQLNFILFCFMSTVDKSDNILIATQSSNFNNGDLVFFNDAYFILFASHVFILAIFGLILSSRQNLILFLLNFEILFLGGGLMFIGFSIYWFYDPTGQIFALFLLFLAAVDSAVGLALFLILKKAGLEFTLKLPTNSNLKSGVNSLTDKDDTENFQVKKLN